MGSSLYTTNALPSMTRKVHSYRQKQLNKVHQKQLLKRNEIINRNIIDLTTYLLRCVIADRSYSNSTLAEFFTAKPDTDREHKQGPGAQTGLRVENTGSAGHIF